MCLYDIIICFFSKIYVPSTHKLFRCFFFVSSYTYVFSTTKSKRIYSGWKKKWRRKTNKQI